MTLLGFIVAAVLFARVWRLLMSGRLKLGARAGADTTCARPAGAASWHDEWHRQWADKFRAQADKRTRHVGREVRRHRRNLQRLRRRAERLGVSLDLGTAVAGDAERQTRPRRREVAQLAFYIHLLSYLGVIALLAFINLLTTRYPWFIWPAMGWGCGVFAHYLAVFGSHTLKARYFDPVVAREVRREKVVMQTEKQASIDELSSTIAHEIRNPIAAAKSLVQQIGEDPHSVENVEYAKVAATELDRVERQISHLLRYAREEDYKFEHVNLAGVVDAALTEMRAKLDAAKVAVARNYIAGPTLLADGEKLRQVFANVIDNAIDALAGVAEGRRIDLFLENGSRQATVRIRDNGCGIPTDRIERTFNPFFTTKAKGTGLGMAIAKKTVEAHEGTIDVVSEPGRGTEFVVTLPLPAKA
jgi:signal transduction histidine kinase